MDFKVSRHILEKEILTIRKNYKKAGQLYKDAVLTAPEDIGSHESTYDQAKKIMEELPPIRHSLAPRHSCPSPVFHFRDPCTL